MRFRIARFERRQRVNNEPAQVLYARIAPGLVQGGNQVNIVPPSG
jgi:hypothetical protein